MSGVTATVASLVVGTADLILLLHWPLNRLPWFDAMRGISERRLKWGGAIGVLVPSVFAAAGATHLFITLLPAGALHSLVVSGALAYAMALGTAAHGAFPYIGAVLKAEDESRGAADGVIAVHAAFAPFFLLSTVPAWNAIPR